MVTFVGRNPMLLALLAAALPPIDGHEFIKADLPPLPQRELRGLEIPPVTPLDSYPVMPARRGDFCNRPGCHACGPQPLRAQAVPRAPLTESEQKVQKRQAKREQKKALRKEAKRLKKRR